MFPLWVKMLPGSLLFFLMLAFPAASSMAYAKEALLIVALLSVGFLSLRSVHIGKSVGLITLSIACVGLFFCIQGMLMRNPGAMPSIPVYVIWPLVYLVILSGIRGEKTLVALDKVVLCAAGAIVFMATAYYLSALHVIPDIPLMSALFTEDEMGFTATEGYTRMAIPGLNTLPFLIPFVLAVLVNRPSLSRRARLGLWSILALSYLLILLSGRRAFQIIAVLSPLMIWAISHFQQKAERTKTRASIRHAIVTLALVIAIAIPSLGMAYDITFSGLTERFTAAFDFGSTTIDDSPRARRDQTYVLLSLWEDRPLLGYGIGAVAHDVIRSEDQPWAYEFYYLDVLFCTGIIGFLIYFAGIAWIYRQSLKIIRAGGQAAQLMFPVLAGVTGFLIASGTNPYLIKFDGLWVIFLPLAIINHWMLSKSFRNSQIIT